MALIQTGTTFLPRAGTTLQHASFTGMEREVTIDTDKWNVIIHDGVTVGGHEASGPQGETGETGDTGPKGDTGDTGSKGDTGDIGPKGDTGDTGADSTVVGPAGADSIVPGPKGDTGDTGETGDGLEIDANGTLAGKDAYDSELENFTYLDTDNGYLYIKESDTLADWSPGVPFSTVDTAAQVLAKIITVDGPGTDLNADLLDGQHASAFSLDGHDHDTDYEPINTTHDDRYYTETEMDAKLLLKSGTGHDHDADYEPLGTTHDTLYEPLASWVHKIASFTAVAGGQYLIDSSITATLPASPSDGDIISFMPAEDLATTPATIARDNTETIMGLAEDMEYNVNIKLTAVYYSATLDWRIS